MFSARRCLRRGQRLQRALQSVVTDGLIRGPNAPHLVLDGFGDAVKDDLEDRVCSASETPVPSLLVGDGNCRPQKLPA